MRARPAAIVTGGGAGFGRETCLALGGRGMPVGVVDINGDAAERTAAAVIAAGGEACAVSADVSDPAAVSAYVDAIEGRYGHIGALANNAAYEGVVAEVSEYPIDEFDRVLAVNVRGVFLGLQHVIPAIRRAGGGAIVNVSSQGGLRGVSQFSAYSASKHAVIGLSQTAALETASDGIRVNTVCPGPSDTRMMRDINTAVSLRGGEPSDMLERIPLGRYGEAEEVARTIAWLLLDAPPFLTGAVLSVDGGMTIA
ncbi:MAG: hypothetical protein QOC68_3799 [Solirubrobacteraceae bacterium]|jgi:NAD(P)-dependent dehydrogenase (short-subunit alcohol dehydrogenase family)|nr:hypothetical protein [Solirubrobacteraceae bacterium]